MTSRDAAQPAYDPIRHRLGMLIRNADEDMPTLSRLLGHPSGWLRTYLRRGTPATLEPRDQDMLARYFNVDPVDMLPRTLREARRAAAHRIGGHAAG